MTELEKVLSTSKRSFEAQESTLKYLRDDVGRLQQRLEDTTTANDDLYLHNLQLREKAQARDKELAETTERITDWEAKFKKLDLQFQRAQQTLEQQSREEEEEEQQGLKSKERTPSSAQQQSEDAQSAMETANVLTRENEQFRLTIQNLQAQLHHYNSSFHNLVGERDTLAQQYQTHVTQMRAHAQEMETNLKVEEEEKAKLEEELAEKLTSLQELKAELDDWKARGSSTEDAERQEVITSTSAASLEARDSPQPSILEMSVNTESQSLTESIVIIRQLQNEIEILRGENSRLNIALEEEGVKAEQLADKIRADEADAADRQQLLINFENDKQALSRALAQNKELKAQLAEMQDGFVHLNEEKCRLTSQLEYERHATKEANHVLQAREEALKRLSAELEGRETRLRQVETKAEQNDVVIKDLEIKLATNSIERNTDQETTLHFGVNQRLMDTLQEELAGAQDAINALSGQNSELRGQVVELERRKIMVKEVVKEGDSVAGAAEIMAAGARRDEEKINELLAQRDALANRYEDTEEKCKALRIQLETMRLHMEASTSANASMFAAAVQEEDQDEAEISTVVVRVDKREEPIPEISFSMSQENRAVEMMDLNEDVDTTGSSNPAVQLEETKFDTATEIENIDLGSVSEEEDDATSNKVNHSSHERVDESMDSIRPTSPHSDLKSQTPRRSISSSSSSPDESSDASSQEGEDDDEDWEVTSRKKKKSHGLCKKKSDLSEGEGQFVNKRDDKENEPKKVSRESASPRGETSKGVDAGVQSDEVMSVSSGSSSETEVELVKWRDKYENLNSSMGKLTQVSIELV